MLRSRSPRPSIVETGLHDSRNELVGSGPSAILRRPILRRDEILTALLLVLLLSFLCSWPSKLPPPLRAGWSARGLRDRKSDANPRSMSLIIRTAARSSRRRATRSESRGAAAGAKPGVKAGSGFVSYKAVCASIARAWFSMRFCRRRKLASSR
jgi:hypothetical protein